MNLEYNYNEFLNKYFGISQIKNEQKEIIDCIIKENRDCLAVLSTGYGKSICFQLPYFILNKIIIVISPLISLMQDQTQKLKKLNIKTYSINSSLSYEEKNNIKKKIINDNHAILYTTPEYFNNNEDFFKLLYKKNYIGLISIDECHCIVEWGYDFRPEYLKLSSIKKRIPNIPILCLTATATDDMKNVIIKKLQLNNPKIVKNSFDRKNLTIYTKNFKKQNDILSDIIPLLDNSKCIIIYTREKKDTLLIYNKIKDIIKCNYYHSDINIDERNKIQTDFLLGNIKCIITTIAFGMGIDNDVDIVIHYGLPDSIESYYQEIGRAGRTGKDAQCYLFYTFKNYKIHENNINKINNEEFRKIKKSKLQDIIKFANINKFCKKIYLYKYFNEKYPENYKNSKYGCNKCNYCINKNNIKKYCEYVYKKGRNKGCQCKNVTKEDDIYCKIHISREEEKNDIIDKINNMKLQELKIFCKNNDIHNYSKLRKDELIKHIINNIKN